MSNKTRKFPLCTVLTVTTKRLLTKRRGPDDNGIGDLYDILTHMTNDSVCTPQLGRFSDECRPWLLRWFPELVPVLGSLRSLDEWVSKAPWLAELRMMFPDIKGEYEIGQIPPDDHEVKDHYDEFVEMRGTDEGVVLLGISGGTT